MWVKLLIAPTNGIISILAFPTRCVFQKPALSKKLNGCFRLKNLGITCLTWWPCLWNWAIKNRSQWEEAGVSFPNILKHLPTKFKQIRILRDIGSNPEGLSHFDPHHHAEGHVDGHSGAHAWAWADSRGQTLQDQLQLQVGASQTSTHQICLEEFRSFSGFIRLPRSDIDLKPNPRTTRNTWVLFLTSLYPSLTRLEKSLFCKVYSDIKKITLNISQIIAALPNKPYSNNNRLDPFANSTVALKQMDQLREPLDWIGPVFCNTVRPLLLVQGKWSYQVCNILWLCNRKALLNISLGGNVLVVAISSFSEEASHDRTIDEERKIFLD